MLKQKGSDHTLIDKSVLIGWKYGLSSNLNHSDFSMKVMADPALHVHGVRPLLVFFILVFFLSSSVAYAMGKKPRKYKEHKTFPITMKVDFGSAGKPAHEGLLFIEKGTTPKEAVSQVFPIMSGKTCCSPREIFEINGVRIDPAKNEWWVCTLNGSKKVSPSKKKLKKGDVVEWRYVKNIQ